MKVCYKCSKEKTLEEFRIKKSRGVYKHNTICKECESLQKKEYYLKNKEEILLKSRERSKTAESKKKRSEYLKKYLVDKKQIIKDKLKKYYQENTKKILKKVSEYKKSQNGKVTLRASSNKRRTQKENKNDGTVTKYSLDILLKVQNNECFYCKNPLDFSIGREVHLDHYIPLSKGGLHSISNVVWSCASCNLKKGSILPDKNIPLVHLNTLFKKLETGPKSPL